uniref:Glycosyltransferase family 92 protein n=1 Tax=Ditylenchus dipsaci TaxID=166011 RepID=A0A915DNC3_9BILA
MFAFDLWHLFITSMVLHDVHKISLVVAYIQSVDSSVFSLIKLFEKSGESADFIAFPDWDDLIVTPNFTPLPIAFNKLSTKYPKAAVFLLDRLNGILLSIDEMTSQKLTFPQFWYKGILYGNVTKCSRCTGAKAVVRPKYVDSVDIHYGGKFAAGYEQKWVPTKDVYIIHARDYHESVFNWHLSNISKMEETFLEIPYLNDIQAILKKLPQKEIMRSTFNKCLKSIHELMLNISALMCIQLGALLMQN